MGFVSANEKHWKALYQANTNLGICVTSDDAYQILRGMRTMGIRLEHHQKSALDIAQWLESRDDVVRVLHPALPSFAGHEMWKRDFKGASGVFSFVLKAEEGKYKQAAAAFLDALTFFGLGYSWAGTNCLRFRCRSSTGLLRRGRRRGRSFACRSGLKT